MAEDETAVLRNKVAELKQRLNQIYSDSFVEVNRSKVFEHEFSLYLKAGEPARKERAEGIKLQHDAVKFGMVALTFASAFTVYLFDVHILFGMLVLLGIGFFSCGFIHLLLAGETRIVRAGGYCAELETYFKQQRWSAGQDEKLNLPAIPLWEEYRSRWEKGLPDRGSYTRTAVFVPFRIAISAIDALALIYVVYSFVAWYPKISWVVLTVSCAAWVLAVSVQMLLVQSAIKRCTALDGADREGADAFRKREISWSPGTWPNILKLFFLLDVTGR